MIKYTSSTIDETVSKLLKRMSPELRYEFDNIDLQFFIFKRTKDWNKITPAVGALVWTTKDCEKLPEKFEFDLFFDKKEFVEFVSKHKKPFEFYHFNKEHLKPLSECSKEIDMEGNPLEDTMEEPSEYAFNKAALCFANRYHISEYELMDAIENAMLEQTLDKMVDDGLLDILPPKEGECELNTTYRVTELGKNILDGLQ